MKKDEVWLVTGSSTGFGRALVEELIAQDYKVVATYNLLYTASRLVQAGLGIALCLDGIVDHPELVFLPCTNQGDEGYYLIWKDRHDQTATEKAFLEEIEAQLYEIEN